MTSPVAGRARRGPNRRPGPQPPRGEFLLEPPPELSETQSGGIGQYLMYLPMIGGAGAMVFMYSGPGATPLTYAASAMYGLSSFGMIAAQFGRGAGDRSRKMDGDRRDYLRYLAQARRRVREAARQQRDAQYWNHPDPACLWSFAMSSRRWERRPEDADFAQLRAATGSQRLALRLVPPETKPVEDLDPITAGALRSFVAAHRTVPDLPVAIGVRNYARVSFDGEPRAVRGLARALLAQAAVFHAPDDLRVAVCAGPDRLPEWEWTKWLPHVLHPTLSDGAGPVRLIRPDLGELEDLLGEDLADRPRFRPGERSADRPQLLIVIDGGRVPPGSQLAVGDAQGVTVLDLQPPPERAPSTHALRLRVTREELSTVAPTPDGGEKTTPIGRPDVLKLNQAEALAHLLLPHHHGGQAPGRAATTAAYDLPRLLNLGDVARLDPAVSWQRRAARDRLCVPIGVGENGAPVELDIKEAAQGGAGPHGLVIGATGSGKSELLRTLVLALASTHSSEALNLVLADFKGGATFLGVEGLPHVSAVITNLAEELPLVDRMQDALRGEMVRRQELLRAAGNYSSVLEYERARAQGEPLEPLPTLLVVVDEFSELLSSKPEFADLFVTIGRLGRSLAVHLLLASQRLEEGRLRGLETHLSYRICLRTFSANESRMVLGVPDAHTLPNEPGNGYLKTDVATMTRFKAAYVSGPYQRQDVPAQAVEVAARQLAPYTAAPVAGPVTPAALAGATAQSGEAGEGPGPRVLDVIVDRLHGKGRPAHQVWLPPLREPPALDALLPGLHLDPGRGLIAAAELRGGLRAPVGVLDRPFEQRRDPLVADLSGAGGNVAVVGGPQSGKSTLLRSLVCGLALTHSPREVQFYCLDFGSGLGALAGLPHVGSVATRLEPDLVRRTVAELTGMLQERERLFAEAGIDSISVHREARAARPGAGDTLPDIVLVVDGWGVLRSDFETLEGAITTLATRGLAYGMHVVIASGRWMEVRSQLRDVLGTRFELRLGDPFESEISRHVAANVPEGTPGRGIVRDNLHFLGALPRIDGDQDPVTLADGTRNLVETVRAAWSGPCAPPVRTLPERLSYEELLRAVPEGSPGIPVGLAEDDLTAATADFSQEPHFIVFGETESGKSGVLRSLAHGITSQYPPSKALAIVIDYRRTLLDAVDQSRLIGFAHSSATAASTVADVLEAMKQRLPGPDVTPAQLRDRSWWQGPDLYLFVDDYDLVVTPSGNPLLPLLEVLPQSRDIGLHVVLARSTGGAARAAYEPFLQRLREMGSPGLVLSGSPDEGALLGNVTARRMPPGRGTLYHRRHGTRLVQTPLVTEGTAPSPAEPGSG
jgi:S-DNA-T family DNA segregation ATPase FtsK/SpoIIIE